MQRNQINDDDFLRLWAEYGQTWSWAQYADALSDLYGLTGDDRFKRSAISAKVSRRREEWARKGTLIPLRRLSHAEMFSSWPESLPAKLRDVYLYRWLEYESLFRQLGMEGVPKSIRETWMATRYHMRRLDEVIRYDPGKGLYRSARSVRERQLDPEHERYYEPRESYLRRHPTDRQPGE